MSPQTAPSTHRPEDPGPPRSIGSRDDQDTFLAQLQVYFEAMYPGCPELRRCSLVERARCKGHFGRLGAVCALLATNSARHDLTDYERLLKVNGYEGLTREEARLVVAKEVDDHLDQWRRSAARDPALRKLRWRLRKRRRALRLTEGTPQKVDAAAMRALVLKENEAITRCLLKWLKRRHTPRRPLR